MGLGLNLLVDVSLRNGSGQLWPTVAHHVSVMPTQLALRNRKIFERCVWLEPFTVRESCVAI